MSNSKKQAEMNRKAIAGLDQTEAREKRLRSHQPEEQASAKAAKTKSKPKTKFKSQKRSTSEFEKYGISSG
jgi:hypothetical protein